MPTGDPQRVWFPEMLARLESQWQESMSFEALIELCDSQDAMLRQIRSERHIPSPVFTCPRCGIRGPMAGPRVSVRAMILALGRFGITTRAKTKTLEREWAKYRGQHGLDLYGKSLLEAHHGERCCGVNPITSRPER
jgi:hypothetical protein